MRWGNVWREKAFDYYFGLLDATVWEKELSEPDAARELEEFNADAQSMLERIEDELSELPPKSWQDRNGELVNEIESDLEDTRDTAKAEWKTAVKEYLQENATVGVRFE